MISGLAPSSTGVYVNRQDWRENSLLKDWVTIPHYFQANGYKTMGGGKIYHASSLSEERYTGVLDPRPWNEYFPSKERQMPQEVDPPNVPTNTRKDFYEGRFDWAELDIEPDEMADAKVVAWASEQLSQTHDQPLFLGVGIYRPHIPWYTPKKYFDLHPADQIQLPEVREGDLEDVPCNRCVALHCIQKLAENRSNTSVGRDSVRGLPTDLERRTRTCPDSWCL